MLVGAVGVARRRAKPCKQQLQPTEIPTLYSWRIRRASVFGWLRWWDFWCGPGMREDCWTIILIQSTTKRMLEDLVCSIKWV